jgi:hypothetical protein
MLHSWEHIKANTAWSDIQRQLMKVKLIMKIILIGEKCKKEISYQHFFFINFTYFSSGSIARQNNFNFRGGICVPASCSDSKALEYANQILSQADLVGSSVTCQTTDPIPFEVIDIVAM